MDAIGASAHLMAVFSGFYESHEPPPLGDVRSIVPLHRHSHQNGQHSRHILHQRFVGAISPGPHPSGNDGV